MQLFLDFAASVLAQLEQHRLLAMAALVLLQTGFALLLLPCSQFTLLAGLLWGPWQGFAVSSAGMLAAATATHFAGRNLVGARLPRIGGRVGRALGRLQTATLPIARDWRAVLLIQAMPFVPASSSGYALGFAGAPLGMFLAATYVGTLPQHGLIVFSGALFQDAVAGEVRPYVIAAVPLFALLLLGVSLVRRRLAHARDQSKPSRLSTM